MQREELNSSVEGLSKLALIISMLLLAILPCSSTIVISWPFCPVAEISFEQLYVRGSIKNNTVPRPVPAHYRPFRTLHSC